MRQLRCVAGVRAFRPLDLEQFETTTAIGLAEGYGARDASWMKIVGRLREHGASADGRRRLDDPNSAN